MRRIETATIVNAGGQDRRGVRARVVALRVAVPANPTRALGLRLPATLLLLTGP